MPDFVIKEEYPPERCETCHQSDKFNSTLNLCSRCDSRARRFRIMVKPFVKPALRVGISSGVFSLAMVISVALFLGSCSSNTNSAVALGPLKTNIYQGAQELDLTGASYPEGFGLAVTLKGHDPSTHEVYKRVLICLRDRFRIVADVTDFQNDYVVVHENNVTVKDLELHLDQVNSEIVTNWLNTKEPEYMAHHTVTPLTLSLSANQVKRNDMIVHQMWLKCYLDESGQRVFRASLRGELPGSSFTVPREAWNFRADQVLISPDLEQGFVRISICESEVAIQKIELHIRRSQTWLSKWLADAQQGWQVYLESEEDKPATASANIEGTAGAVATPAASNASGPR